MFGNVFGSVFSAVSQVALGAMTGGMSIVAQLAMQVMSQVIKQVIQQVGQQIGLPQPLIDSALGAFDAASGLGGGVGGALGQIVGQTAGQTISNFAQQQGIGALEEGRMQQAADTSRNQIMQMVESARGQDEEGNPTGRSAGRSVSGGGSWLMALARALGAQLNAAQGELERTMQGTDWKEAGQVAEFQAQSQQFALFMNTATNVIKTVGESLSTMSRKG